MNESRKTNGNGSDRHWRHRPLPIITMVLTVVAFLVTSTTFIVGADFRSVENAERIDRMETRMEKTLEAINDKLNQLFEPRFARRR